MRKKITELEAKPAPALTDILPIVDMALVNRKTKKTSLQDLRELFDSVPNSEKGAASGVATLDAQGRLLVAQVPSIAVTETFVVSSQAAMLALPAQLGDFAVREDERKTYALAASDPAVLSNWQEILTPVPSLTSLPDVNTGVPTVRSALVYDPDTQLWRSADIAKLTDGGDF
jgi:hypothetical protein